MAKKFKNLFRRNKRNYSKYKQVRKFFPNYRKKKDFSKEPHICYGRGHIAEDCGNKKNKFKPKGKAMAVTWDNDSEVSKNKSQGSEEGVS